MKDFEFFAQVRQRAELPSQEDAIKVTQVVLDTLGERLNGSEPFELGSQLPADVASALNPSVDRPAETFGIHEFINRVADREGEDRERAHQQSTAVLSTLADAVSPGELNQLISQLPSGYAELFGYPELA